MQDLKPKDFKTFVKEDLGLGIGLDICQTCGGNEIDCTHIQDVSKLRRSCWFPKGKLLVWNVEGV